MADYDEPISDAEKVRIASDFIKHAPPGEFNEVFNDVRILLSNDNLLKEEAARFCKEKIKAFFFSIRKCDWKVLVTKHGELPDGRFHDPRSKKAFHYDHLRKEASNLADHDPNPTAEPWRSAIEESVTAYVRDHYPHGVCTVCTNISIGILGSRPLFAILLLTLAILSIFRNGRWRSEWSVSFQPSGGNVEVTGILKVQVHYYEDGNVQLVTTKEVKEDLKVTSEHGTAKHFLQIVDNAETDYQRALSENYSTMSDTTFKALRRQLPITRTKIDWNKILNYKIGQELKSS
ncbi:unnamed protein product [Porites evermanni]|uniref:F-actin-capping protein subunit alpha n=1 Tax=Porites evermanni TaxID=104178 RepID=A0ABN8MFT2_9CNID|nr:unnamed protein product [Porites evermanni]